MCVCRCCQSVGFCPKSQDFLSSDLLIIICKLGMLGFFFNMAPSSTIHLQTILGFFQVLRILVKKCWHHWCVCVWYFSDSRACDVFLL